MKGKKHKGQKARNEAPLPLPLALVKRHFHYNECEHVIEGNKTLQFLPGKTCTRGTRATHEYPANGLTHIRSCREDARGARAPVPHCVRRDGNWGWGNGAEGGDEGVAGAQRWHFSLARIGNYAAGVEQYGGDFDSNARVFRPAPRILCELARRIMAPLFRNLEIQIFPAGAFKVLGWTFSAVAPVRRSSSKRETPVIRDL
jgi:hypothetical protein